MATLFLDEVVFSENRENERYKTYLSALRTLLSEPARQSLRAALIYGSLARNEIKDASDIDILFICEDAQGAGECFKELRVDDIRFDSWEISEKNLSNTMKGEPGRVARPISGILSDAVHVFGDPQVTTGLREKALASLASPVPKLDFEGTRNLFNFIESRVPIELEKIRLRSQVGWVFEVHGILSRYFDAIHQLEGVLIPQSKRMTDNLSHLNDRVFAKLYAEALTLSPSTGKPESFYELSRHVRQRLGDFLKITRQ